MKIDAAEDTARRSGDRVWARTWSASPQHPSAATSAVEPFRDATLWQTIRISGGGGPARVRFTNEFGDAPVTIRSARVRLTSADGVALLGSDRPLTFSGNSGITIPKGAPALSDPVDWTGDETLGATLPDLADLTVSIYVEGQVVTPTSHGGADVLAWITPGDTSAALRRPDDATPLPALALLSAVEVLSSRPAKTIVAIGDSLTDGVGSTSNAHHGWLDLLAERLLARRTAGAFVANQGISGNRVLNDGLGEAILSRFDRDVLSTPNLGFVIVLAGLNDIALSFAPRTGIGPEAEFMQAFAGDPISADDLIAGYQQLIARTHQHAAKIYGATLPPYGRSDTFTDSGEAARQEVNGWIRTSGQFDAVLDVDAVWRDADDPSVHVDSFHAGDHLHGSDLGYRAVADSIDLTLFD